jgi:phage tail sheath protein FI
VPEAAADRLGDVFAAAALQGGYDGLGALTVDDFLGEESAADDSDTAILNQRLGLAALGEVDEISLVAVPDIHIQPRVPVFVPPPACVPDPCLPSPPLNAAPVILASEDVAPVFSGSDVERVAAALVDHCERHADRLALLDPPFTSATRDRLGLAAIRAFRSQFDSTFAALYFPWVEVLDPLPGARTPTLAIPPSGHVAGQIAATDLRIGVHKAPANVPLEMAERPTFVLDETAHGILNTDGINCIRAVPGRGLRIAGARLVSSRTELRFVNVRRLLLMIERALTAQLQWAVFEGNDWRTWTRLRLLIDGFLRDLWGRGALVGSTAEEAYFICCDASNNPPDARARGELYIDIGVAATVPFEFVVLRIGRSAGSLELTEPDPAGA